MAKIEPGKEFTLSKKVAAPLAGATAEDEESMMNVTSEEDGMNAPTGAKGIVDGESEAIDVPLRPEEKRRLNWENGLYLAPLTTVGNLVRYPTCTYALSLTSSPSDVYVSIMERQSQFLKWPWLNLS